MAVPVTSPLINQKLRGVRNIGRNAARLRSMSAHASQGSEAPVVSASRDIADEPIRLIGLPRAVDKAKNPHADPLIT